MYSFNFIFKVNKPRCITTKITLYWTVITLGPLLLGTAFSLKGYANYVFHSVAEFQVVLGYILPFLLTWLVLAGVYIFVPNKKVGLINALIGALVAMFLFWLLKNGFSFFMLKNINFSKKQVDKQIETCYDIATERENREPLGR